ncbi:unnamed protein product [Diamesa serratosioi]
MSFSPSCKSCAFSCCKSCVSSCSSCCSGTKSCCAPKTIGPIGKEHDVFAKYAPVGHWSSCVPRNAKKLFNPCETYEKKSPYGPYGPWGKGGPLNFKSPKDTYLKMIYSKIPRNRRDGVNTRSKKPLGKLAPWPLSGSCRYAGRPYGPCRPDGSYRSRGPFGIWCRTRLDVNGKACRPVTPLQPCWHPSKIGHRPCTPCHRPLFRPCRVCPDLVTNKF